MLQNNLYRTPATLVTIVRKVMYVNDGRFHQYVINP